MKKLLSILLIVAMLIPVASINSFAATRKATWTFKASVYDIAKNEATDKTNFTKGGSTVYNSANTSNITVKPGQVVWVTLHLKTSSNFYPGELTTYVFYSNSIFTSAKESNFVWNTNGSYTNLCDNTANVYSKMTEKFKSKGYPSKWSDATKKANEFYAIVMIPDVSQKAVATVDEDLVSFPVYIKSDAKAGSTGEIYITQDDLCTESNKNGKFELNYYENGDMSKDSVQYSKNVTHDTSKAKITFTVEGGSTPSTPETTSIFTEIANFFKSIWNAITSLFGIFTK